MLILAYHSIAPGAPPLHVAPEAFSEHVHLLLEAGYRAVALRDALGWLDAGDALERRCFALTFDDGYRDFLEHALPRLEARGLPATLFALAPDPAAGPPRWGGSPLLSPRELREVSERGVEIGSHTVSHPDLRRLEPEALERELADARHRLEDWIGGEVVGFAYPYGRFDARVLAAVRSRYRYACATWLGRVPRAADPHVLPRVDAHYLRSPCLRRLLRWGAPEPYLAWRRALRAARGSERGAGRSLRYPGRFRGRLRVPAAPAAAAFSRRAAASPGDRSSS